MSNTTQNLQLIMPELDEQYNVNVWNTNSQKIDDFAGLTPPLATTAYTLVNGAKINGVNFKGNQDIVTGIGLYSNTVVYNNTNACYGFTQDGLLFYRSLQNNNVGHALTDTSYWEVIDFSDKGIIGKPEFTLDFNNKPEDCVWLEGQVASQSAYPQLYAIYGQDYWDKTTVVDTTTEFQLPNFQGMTIWGGTTAGYITAGLPNITGSFGCDNNSLGASGAFYQNTGSNHNVGANVDDKGKMNFSASRSNSIYGKSSTVQPPAIRVRVYTRYE